LSGPTLPPNPDESDIMTDTATPNFKNTNLHAIFATDESLEEAGAWVDINELYGLKIKVRRMRSDASLKAYERIVRERFGEGKLRKPEDLTGSESEEILKQQLAEAILIDWEGLYDADGNAVPYSVPAALAFLEVKDFREFVYQAANERGTFREKADEDAVKN